MDIDGYYQAIPIAGGPTAAGEMTGGSNPSDTDVTQPSPPAGDPAAHASVDDATGELDVNVTDDHIPGNGLPSRFDPHLRLRGGRQARGVRLRVGRQLPPDRHPDPAARIDVMDVTQENGSLIQFGLTNSGPGPRPPAPTPP